VTYCCLYEAGERDEREMYKGIRVSRKRRKGEVSDGTILIQIENIWL